MAILPGAIIFLAALLLFQLQPMMGKSILPWFGGGASVWTVCMLFFQSMLLAGYAYAHWIGRRLSIRRQVLVHGALLVISLVFLPVAPAEVFRPSPGADPTLGVLVLMLATVGLPFFLLAASSPLLQYWSNRIVPSDSVYRLYALSNFGSLLGLGIYPFLLEPVFGLTRQQWIWSSAYVLFVLASGGYARLMRRQPAQQPPADAGSGLSAGVTQRLLWVALPACGSLLLLASTNRITQDVAPMPLLWVLPLALYLVSFIVTFDRPDWYHRGVWIPLLAAALAAAVWLLYANELTDIRLQIAALASILFVGCMVCHGELFRLRPDPAGLTGFYLHVALGGAVGGLFVALIAPLIFSQLWEYLVALILTPSLLLLVLLREHRRSRRNRWRLALMPLIGLGIAGLSFALAGHVGRKNDNALISARNFYGVLMVDEINRNGPAWRRTLWHGRVPHGAQLMWPKFRHLTTVYYAPNSGGALALRFRPDDGGGLKVGAIGLGVGTVAEYLTERDSIRFYEIDPQVVELSTRYFTYLRQARGQVDVVMGDARMSLARELELGGGQNFDVLLVDAFNSDAVPVHLLTREAFELYWRHLKADGVLAVHTTAVHVDFVPLVEGLALVMNKQAVVVRDPGRGQGAAHSVWVLVTQNEEFLNSGLIRRYPRSQQSAPPGTEIWTDDYSNLLTYLQWKGKDYWK